MPAADDISKYRLAIDAIDDQLIDLLNERSLIVKKVGKIKKKNLKKGVCYIRAGREAELVRRIHGKLKQGVFPAAAAAQIWRLIIDASLSLESELKVVCDSDNTIYLHAREYFGKFTPIAKQKKASEIIKAVKNGKAQVGVLSIHKSNWWLDLPEELKIFACVPFVLEENENINALAVARVSPEETENDVTLLKLSATQKITTQKIKSLFAKHKLNAKIVSSIKNAHLLEINGFISDNEKVIATIKKETGFALSVLGSYAVPIKL